MRSHLLHRSTPGPATHSNHARLGRATPCLCKATKKGPGEDTEKSALEKIDPFKLGRRSRQVFDDVWNQFAKLTSPTSSFSEDQLGVFADSTLDFQTPEAGNTTVLVLGSTGTVGTVVVRKLLLRGYMVKAMVRNKEAAEPDLPPAVDIVQGDLTSYNDCLQAVRGVDKIIYAAASRSLEVADFHSVEKKGVANIVRALQDSKHNKAQTRGGQSAAVKRSLADFAVEGVFEKFTIQGLGEDSDSRIDVKKIDGEDVWFKGTDSAQVTLSDFNNLLFKGDVLAPGSLAEVGRPLNEDEALTRFDGILMRVLGDGHTYSFVLTSRTTGKKFGSRFSTRKGYSTIRLPFSTFRPEDNRDPPLDLKDISTIAIRFRNLGPSPDTRLLPSEFKLEVDWIKGLPAGQETDFVLVSCAGQPRPNISDTVLGSLIKSKRAGEQKVRHSGLGYTIVRATNLMREPGGYKALLFDQGDRLSESISAADVADICVRSLHQRMARNMTFEVSQENTPEGGLEMYELIAHVPDRSTNYLSAALQTLERNT